MSFDELFNSWDSLMYNRVFFFLGVIIYSVLRVNNRVIH